MDKFISVEQAVSMVKDGMTLMIGGFLGVGSANKVLKGIHDAGIKNLTIIGNDTAFVDKGVGILVANHQVKKAIVSHMNSYRREHLQNVSVAAALVLVVFSLQLDLEPLLQKESA